MTSSAWMPSSRTIRARPTKQTWRPRQRPDMGYARFIQALLEGTPVTVFGDGHQARGNTYVSDCVEATVAAIQAPTGEVFNVGGGESASVWEVLAKLEALTGRRPIL